MKLPPTKKEQSSKGKLGSLLLTTVVARSFLYAGKYTNREKRDFFPLYLLPATGTEIDSNIGGTVMKYSFTSNIVRMDEGTKCHENNCNESNDMTPSTNTCKLNST